MRGILTYHSIDSSGSPVSVHPLTFRRHMEWFASGRVPVVPLERLLQLPPEAHAVALTFDDGFANFAEEAAPLLADSGLPATLFIVSDYVGRTNSWGGAPDPRVPVLPLLDWDALGRVAERGVTLGAHTRTHPHLTRLTPAQAEQQLGGALEHIEEELGCTVGDVSYPYGDVDDTVRSLARRFYARGVTTELRPLDATDDALLLPRLDAYYFQAPGRLENWGTAGFRRHLWLRAQGRRLRTALAGAGTW